MIRLKTLGLIGLIVSLALVSGCGRKGRKPTEAPLAPSNLTATGISYHEIRLSWQDRSNNESGFKIYCSYFQNGPYYLIGEMSANSTGGIHYELSPLSTYWYYVSAYNNKGAASSNKASGTTQSGVEILSQNLGEQYGDAYLTGQARNVTDRMLSSVTLTAWFYDSGGILLDTASDYGSDIPAQTTWNFEIWAISIPRASVARYDLEVTNVRIQSTNQQEEGSFAK